MWDQRLQRKLIKKFRTYFEFSNYNFFLWCSEPDYDSGYLIQMYYCTLNKYYTINNPNNLHILLN